MKEYLSSQGFEVIGFDGPGQGAALRENHCQIGNMALALDVMAEWIGKVTEA